MNKDNVFRSSDFFMAEGDVLHMIIIDEQGDPFYIDLKGDSVNSVPDQPTLDDASNVTSSSFTVSWSFIENSSGYSLDVATDSAFTSMVAGYDGLDVGNVTEYDVIGLNPNGTYYFRLQAYNENGYGVVSESGNTTTLVLVANDWFLPSRDELADMRTNLYLNGIGDLTANIYWSSSEYNLSGAWDQDFNTGTQGNGGKNSPYYVRAVRTFTSSSVYALGDFGQAGWIFHITNLGGGFYTYYECSQTDQSSGKAWSNITGVAIGTTSVIVGEGQNNTNEIMAQVGHTDSAAKLCYDLVL